MTQADKYTEELAKLAQDAGAELARDKEQLEKVHAILKGKIEEGSLPSSQQTIQVQKLATIEDVTKAISEMSDQIASVSKALAERETTTPTHS